MSLQALGLHAPQPKLPRRKLKLREHRKARKMKAKGRRPTEDGALAAGEWTAVAA
jgi:hypothetical protein